MSITEITANESWRPVVGYPDYEVSDQGQVRSLDRAIVNVLGVWKRRRGIVLKRTPTKAARVRFYHRVRIAGRNRSVAGLVLEAFVGPRPPGQVIRHLNDDGLDDRLENLAWGTHRDNGQDKVRNGRAAKKLPNEVMDDIRAAYAGGESQQSIANRYGVSQHAICQRLKQTVALAFVAVAAVGMVSPPNASADPGVGCITEKWGFLWSSRRTICDGPRRADGSWTRARVVWTPAGYAPFRTYCSRYSCTSSGGYYYNESVQAKETYVVFDTNVLGDEPGWLPAGTDVIR